MYQPNAPCAAPNAKIPNNFTASADEMRLDATNQTSGAKNTTPITRPSSRCRYSHQKMPLNSASVIALLICRYSGVSLYFANVCSHCASDSGGIAPTIGCHSVIDKPECVRRVTPPTT